MGALAGDPLEDLHREWLADLRQELAEAFAAEQELADAKAAGVCVDADGESVVGE
jgi:hypothetical protein